LSLQIKVSLNHKQLFALQLLFGSMLFFTPARIKIGPFLKPRRRKSTGIMLFALALATPTKAESECRF